MTCNQKGCNEPATHRVFWPGNPPMLCCQPHAEKALGVGMAMGCYIHVEVLTAEQAAREAPHAD